MHNTKKHVFSFCCLAAFAFFALASTVNKLHMGAFNYSNSVEDTSETRSYLLLNDGTKVYGDRIVWKAGLLQKKQIKIDDQAFHSSEVTGYRSGATFYGRVGNEFVQRIVRGKINVYVQFTEVTNTTTDHNGFTHSYSYTRTDYYAQKGDFAPLVGFANKTDIMRLVAGCPVAVAMADKSYHQLSKSVRHNRNYMNEIFETYNNDCKPVNP
ncbi:hypothetical protein [Dinghuibacter silviterrae]|uniref:Uncharacterized protein n=1 Tax=Dinghuibacter silviterrae TaxID=1539049 RepID=A0A4R8DF21_9BACT|nr:hypothetical protein [Dinghuibacter silviterrae]TDW95834.1 hypothetical protein EDB95_3648 [Dinghuibacter silviterrae]